MGQINGGRREVIWQKKMMCRPIPSTGDAEWLVAYQLSKEHWVGTIKYCL
jgi:hypothetical protein